MRLKRTPTSSQKGSYSFSSLLKGKSRYDHSHTRSTPTVKVLPKPAIDHEKEKYICINSQGKRVQVFVEIIVKKKKKDDEVDWMDLDFGSADLQGNTIPDQFQCPASFQWKAPEKEISFGHVWGTSEAVLNALKQNQKRMAMITPNTPKIEECSSSAWKQEEPDSSGWLDTSRMSNPFQETFGKEKEQSSGWNVSDDPPWDILDNHSTDSAVKHESKQDSWNVTDDSNWNLAENESPWIQNNLSNIQNFIQEVSNEQIEVPRTPRNSVIEIPNVSVPRTPRNSIVEIPNISVPEHSNQKNSFSNSETKVAFDTFRKPNSADISQASNEVEQSPSNGWGFEETGWEVPEKSNIDPWIKHNIPNIQKFILESPIVQQIPKEAPKAKITVENAINKKGRPKKVQPFVNDVQWEIQEDDSWDNLNQGCSEDKEPWMIKEKAPVDGADKVLVDENNIYQENIQQNLKRKASNDFLSNNTTGWHSGPANHMDEPWMNNGTKKSRLENANHSTFEVKPSAAHERSLSRSKSRESNKSFSKKFKMRDMTAMPVDITKPPIIRSRKSPNRAENQTSNAEKSGWDRYYDDSREQHEELPRDTSWDRCRNQADRVTSSDKQQGDWGVTESDSAWDSLLPKIVCPPDLDGILERNKIEEKEKIFDADFKEVELDDIPAYDNEPEFRPRTKKEREMAKRRKEHQQEMDKLRQEVQREKEELEPGEIAEWDDGLVDMRE